MATLSELRADSQLALSNFENEVSKIAPHLEKWDWYRALSAKKGEIGRHNEDKTFDDALANSPVIATAHILYITALHRFYTLRDGPNGFLGRA